MFRSTDRGRTWTEAKRPPAFRKAKKGEPKRAVHHVFWLRAGHAEEPGVWYAGTSPQGLFRSDDDGETWASIDGFNQHPMLQAWTGGEKDGTPDGPKLHAIPVDPRDSQHLYVGCSSGGVFESPDGGATWTPLNKGCAADFLPTKDAEYGHDPHCLVQHPADPDVLYQQNHCGIYRMDRHRQQSHRDALTAGEQHVHLARCRVIIDLAGETDQSVGLATHGRDDHDNLMAFIAESLDLLGDGLDPLHRADRSASELLNV